MKINRISFIPQGYGQVFFRFADSTGAWHSALLQLPITPDSQNSIDCDTWDDDAEKDAICEELTDFFYSRFKSIDHAIASICTGFEVTHLIEVDNFYVAFSAEKAAVLKGAWVSRYYNVFFFEPAHHYYNEDDDESEIIGRATSKLFSALSDSLHAQCVECAKLNDFNDESKSDIEQCFDDVTHKFMRSEFGTSDYDATGIAGDFYHLHACGIRNLWAHLKTLKN